MTSKDYDLNCWEQNSIRIPTVQGEEDSRTINFHLKEEVNVLTATENMEIRVKPIDLTGCSVRLYCEKPDNTRVFCDGTVSDAANGITTVVLPFQSTTASGTVSCQMLITKSDGTTLIPVGITLAVASSNMRSLESTDEFNALVKELNKAETAAATAVQTATTAAEAAASAATAVQTANEANAQASAVATEITTKQAAIDTAESTRQSQESTRQTQEGKRQTAESARVTAEAKRQTDTEAAISGAVQQIVMAGITLPKSAGSVILPNPFMDRSDISQKDYTDGSNASLLCPGVYSLESVTSNNPFYAGAAYQLYVYPVYSVGNSLQFLQIAVSKSNGAIKVRKVSDTGSSEGWFPQQDDGSTNKHYIKCADGTLIEYGIVPATVTLTQAYGSMYHNTDYITLLNSFVGDVTGHVDIRTTGIVDAWGAYYDTSTGRLSFTLISPVSVSNLGIQEIYFAIGRWKSPVG